MIDPEVLESLEPTDFRELAGALLAHHMRRAGKLDTGVSRETVEPSPPESAADVDMMNSEPQVTSA